MIYFISFSCEELSNNAFVCFMCVILFLSLEFIAFYCQQIHIQKLSTVPYAALHVGSMAPTLMNARPHLCGVGLTRTRARGQLGPGTKTVSFCMFRFRVRVRNRVRIRLRVRVRVRGKMTKNDSFCSWAEAELSPGLVRVSPDPFVQLSMVC